MRIVEVEWDDSVTHSTPWVSPDDLKLDGLAMRCTSVGYLVHQTPEAVVLAQSASFSRAGEVEEYGQPITIPRVAITKGPTELS